MHNLRVFLAFMKLWMQHQMEFRSAFIAGFLNTLFLWTAELLAIWVVVNRFGSIGGWSAYEVALLYFMNMLAYGLSALIASRTFSRLGEFIRSGEFDEFLIRPMSPAAYFIVKQSRYAYFGHVMMSFGLIAVCFAGLGIHFTVAKVLLFLLMALSIGAIQFSLTFFAGAASFWLVETGAIADFLLWMPRDFTQYPLSIYPRAIQIILTFMIPYGFISFYPVQLFLDKTGEYLFHPSFQYLTPAVAAVLMIAVFVVWRLGIRHYQSVGT